AVRTGQPEHAARDALAHLDALDRRRIRTHRHVRSHAHRPKRRGESPKNCGCANAAYTGTSAPTAETPSVGSGAEVRVVVVALECPVADEAAAPAGPLGDGRVLRSGPARSGLAHPPHAHEQ